METSEFLKLVDAPAVAVVMYLWLRSTQEQLKRKDEQIADLANRFANIVEKQVLGGD